MDRRSRLAAASLAALLALGPTALAACGDDTDDSTAGSTAPTSSSAPVAEASPAEAALAEGRTVIDVRTPEEYATGHVAGAQLIDVQGADFTDQIAALPDDGSYVVYCRSGNRSAVAAAEMTDIGLDVLDGGAFSDMLDAGWPRG